MSPSPTTAINETPTRLAQPASDTGTLQLLFKRCPACDTLAFPPGLPACAVCGTPLTDTPAEPHDAPCILREFVTVHAPLVPDLPVPVVIGEIEVTPGVFRQGVVNVANEDQLSLGQPLRPVASAPAAFAPCVFEPLDCAPR